MTERKKALTDLLEKVEDGSEDNPNFSSMVNRPIMQCKASEAYRGSLDAAKDLHKAVLPGWLYSIHSGIEADVVKVCPSILPEPEGHTGVAFEENPARAWLTAILKALIAMEKDDA